MLCYENFFRSFFTWLLLSVRFCVCMWRYVLLHVINTNRLNDLLIIYYPPLEVIILYMNYLLCFIKCFFFVDQQRAKRRVCAFSLKKNKSNDDNDEQIPIKNRDNAFDDDVLVSVSACYRYR